MKKDGHSVAVVQNPTVSLADDVDVTKRAIDAQSAPVTLVGHSYGEAVTTEAGTHPMVAALVYIAAFAPDTGESVNTLIAGSAARWHLVAPILPPQDGFLFLDREKFHASFAGDVSAEQAAFMADSQVPWGVDALGGTVSEPAWRSKPSWYLVATEDRMIPPPAQRQMSARAGSTVVEVAGSHAIYVSQPAAVADLIKQAASEASSAARLNERGFFASRPASLQASTTTAPRLQPVLCPFARPSARTAESAAAVAWSSRCWLGGRAPFRVEAGRVPAGEAGAGS